jgi:hypothetical protein
MRSAAKQTELPKDAQFVRHRDGLAAVGPGEPGAHDAVEVDMTTG